MRCSLSAKIYGSSGSSSGPSPQIGEQLDQQHCGKDHRHAEIADKFQPLAENERAAEGSGKKGHYNWEGVDYTKKKAEADKREIAE